MEIITAGDGKAHVSSADDGMLYAGISGTGCYVHMTGNSLACRMETANKATVDTGSGFMFGRGFRFAAPESVTIQSGTQAQRRNDIIGIRFTTSTTGEESGRLEVIRGTPTSGATASDPPVPTSSMLDGATTGWMSLYRIRLDGISVSEPEPMFDVLAPLSKIQSDLAALRDSVSQKHRIITGTKSLKWVWPGVTCPILSDSEFRALAGRSFDNDRDMVMIMNGDWSANGIPTAGAVWLPTDRTLYAAMASVPKMNSWLRINYALIVAP